MLHFGFSMTNRNPKKIWCCPKNRSKKKSIDPKINTHSPYSIIHICMYVFLFCSCLFWLKRCKKKHCSFYPCIFSIRPWFESSRSSSGKRCHGKLRFSWNWNWQGQFDVNLVVGFLGTFPFFPLDIYLKASKKSMSFHFPPCKTFKKIEKNMVSVHFAYAASGFCRDRSLLPFPLPSFTPRFWQIAFTHLGLDGLAQGWHSERPELQGFGQHAWDVSPWIFFPVENLFFATSERWLHLGENSKKNEKTELSFRKAWWKILKL